MLLMILDIFISVLIGAAAAVPFLALVAENKYTDRYTYEGVPFNGSKMQLKAAARNKAALKAIALQHQIGKLSILDFTQQDMVDLLDLAKADAVTHLPDARWVKQCESFIPKEHAAPRLEQVEKLCDFLLKAVVPLNDQIQTIKQGSETQEAKKEQYNQKLKEYEKLFLIPALAGGKQMKSIPSKLSKKGIFQWNG